MEKVLEMSCQKIFPKKSVNSETTELPGLVIFLMRLVVEKITKVIKITKVKLCCVCVCGEGTVKLL